MSYYKDIPRLKLLLFGWSFFVLLVCFIPGSEIPKPSLINIPHFDKIVHFTLFVPLSFLYLRVYDFVFFKVILFIVLFGGFTELIQLLYIPNRTGDVFDFLADLSGGALGIWVYAVMERKYRN